MYDAHVSDAPAVDNRHWPDPPPPPARASGHQAAGQPPVSWAFQAPNGHHPANVPAPGPAHGDWQDHGVLPPDAGPARPALPELALGHWANPPGPAPDPWQSRHADVGGSGGGPPDWYAEPGREPNSYQPAGHGPGTAPGGPRHGWTPPGGPVPPPRGPEEAQYEPPPGWLPVLAATAGAFLIPVLAYLLWSVTLSGEAPAGCVDAVGAACRSPRADALANLRGVAPAVTAALALALVIATGLRRISRWRSFTIAFAAAVIGTGLVTLIASALG